MVTSSVIVSSQLVPATQISLRNLRALCASALSFSSSYSPLSFFFSPRSFKLRKLEGSQSPSNLFRIKSFADPHPLTLMESNLYKKHRGGVPDHVRVSPCLWSASAQELPQLMCFHRFPRSRMHLRRVGRASSSTNRNPPIPHLQHSASSIRPAGV